jgi:hypothetical protein
LAVQLARISAHLLQLNNPAALLPSRFMNVEYAPPAEIPIKTSVSALV